MTYRYYLVYRYGESVGSECIVRDSPIDSETAILAEHERLERTFKVPVVILDWKRID
jgi:hypothetical protein